MYEFYFIATNARIMSLVINLVLNFTKIHIIEFMNSLIEMYLKVIIK